MKPSLLLTLSLLLLSIISCTGIGSPAPQPPRLASSPLARTPSAVPVTDTLTPTAAIANTPTNSPTSQLVATRASTPQATAINSTGTLEPTAASAVAKQNARTLATMHAMAWPTTIETPDPYNLIDDALARGEIDIDHATVFRLYSLFGSPYLPPGFTGPLIRGDGLGAFMYALKDFDLTSIATQRFVGGYVTPRRVIPTTPSATLPASLSSILPGPWIYSTTLTEQDNLEGAQQLAGRWKLDMTVTGRATLYHNQKLVVTRETTTYGEQFIFNDLFGSYACDDDGHNAIYAWAIQNQTLAFKMVSDSCRERVRLMESHPWSKQ